MLKITIIALGKLKEKAYVELEREFLKRLSPFVKFRLLEFPEESYRQGQDIEKIKLKEAEKILLHLPKNSYAILLQEAGQQLDSTKFAQLLQREGGNGRELVFVIGSGIGLHKSLKNFSQYEISLSPLTFPHNLARILLEEQIYRACTILAGKEYHK